MKADASNAAANLMTAPSLARHVRLVPEARSFDHIVRTAQEAYSGNPAFRRPSINSFEFLGTRAICADIVKAGSISSTRAAAACASASRPRWAKADARPRQA